MNNLTNTRCKHCDHFKYLHEEKCVVTRCDCERFVPPRERVSNSSLYKFRFDRLQYPKARVTSKENLERWEGARRYERL